MSEQIEPKPRPITTVLEWLPVQYAEKNQTYLVIGNGPLRFGYLDGAGQWRARHHGAFRSAPKFFTRVVTMEEMP